MSGGFLDFDRAAARVGKSRSTIRRWVEAELLHPVLGMVRESELLEADRKMRARRGRPRGAGSSRRPDPVAVVEEAIGRGGDAEAAVDALRVAGLLRDGGRGKVEKVI
ncbi:hypothetical protein Leucomu_13440 [Leucobacter muris]|uniref:DNA-binding protein n=1 Tax=Leucobacter muris TaxID=1935379 RepID=A0ABX5QI70_9MICO|nr:hypothetical protein [Leucobacter muris]QAB18779.1 hypothetical protein Leucomu_13440 [Leucobacter muris]